MENSVAPYSKFVFIFHLNSRHRSHPQLQKKKKSVVLFSSKQTFLKPPSTQPKKRSKNSGRGTWWCLNGQLGCWVGVHFIDCAWPRLKRDIMIALRYLLRLSDHIFHFTKDTVDVLFTVYKSAEFWLMSCDWNDLSNNDSSREEEESVHLCGAGLVGD